MAVRGAHLCIVRGRVIGHPAHRGQRAERARGGSNPRQIGRPVHSQPRGRDRNHQRIDERVGELRAERVGRRDRGASRDAGGAADGDGGQLVGADGAQGNRHDPAEQHDTRMSGHPLAKPEKSGFHTSPVGLALAANGNAFFPSWGTGRQPRLDFDVTIEWINVVIARRMSPHGRKYFNEGLGRFEEFRRRRRAIPLDARAARMCAGAGCKPHVSSPAWAVARDRWNEWGMSFLLSCTPTSHPWCCVPADRRRASPTRRSMMPRRQKGS